MSLRLLLVAPLLLLLLGCRSPAPGTPPASGRLRVLTSALPVHLFTRAVAGRCAEVEPLLPGDADPHDVAIRPSDLARLRGADLLVINGLGLEAFLMPLLRSAGASAPELLDAGRDLPAASLVGAAEAGGHAHDHAHDHGPVNPHVWLDPRLAARQVETIRDGLRAADPACGPTYDANAAAFLAELADLDAELERRLRPHAGRTFVAFHDIAPYFARRYGLRARFLVAVPEERPSAADLRRVEQLVRRQGLRALLGEPGRPDPVFTALAGDLGVPILAFDPLETAPDGDQAALPPQHYLSTMRRNLSALLQALGAGDVAWRPWK